MTVREKYVIIDIRKMDIFKDDKDEIIYFDTETEASEACGMYEFENVWIMKLIYNYIDANNIKEELLKETQ